MNNITADLHIHTSFSDGLYSPVDILKMAKERNLKAIAISDHDTFNGLQALQETNDQSIKIIPAIELSSELELKNKTIDIHILGYFVDPQNKSLLEELSVFRKARITRAEKIVKNLNGLGLNIKYSEVIEMARTGVVGRMHIARALVSNGNVNSTAQAFKDYIGNDSLSYVPKYKINQEAAIKLIRNAGGIPVWAHPGRLNCDHILPDFINSGLMGIEVYHPSHTGKDVKRYKKLAKKNNLLITGGSDFHGTNSEIRPGDYGIDDQLLEKFLVAGEKL